jgi:hypothetical protein
MPGITHESLTTHLVNTCESRGDAIAVIDLPDCFIPEHEDLKEIAIERLGDSVTEVVNALQSRGLNSSYGATYYPWVQIRDTVTNRNVMVPPSVVALGAMSYGQAVQELWFAPAGFTRGGLSEGRGAVPVIGVSKRLNADERDALYEANINPIASFPAEGIVIFGQKTLQITPSALDRINVRRLVIFLKRQISIIASRILFDQNVSVTWNRFKSQATSFLDSVQSRLGITEYRLILDETTTTPDLVDRNVVYAKIFIKPARAIEYIAIDFVIAGSGASGNTNGPALSAEFSTPLGVFLDNNGDLFVTEYDGNKVRKVSSVALNSSEFQANNLKFNLYPNPASEMITIEMDSEVKTVEIYSIHGQKVQTSNTKSVVLNKLAAGIYFVKVEDVNGLTNTKKLVIK